MMEERSGSRLGDYSRGYDAGNYDNAYASEELALCNVRGRSADYRAGYVLGFFSSYETREVPAEWRAELAELRKAYPEA